MPQPPKKFDLFHRIEELPSRLYVIFAVVAMAIHITVCTYTDASPASAGLVILCLYLLSALVVYLFSRRRLRIFRHESDASEEQNNSVVFAFRNRIKIPYAVVSENGKIVTVNNAMRHVAGLWDTVLGAEIEDVCHCTLAELLAVADDGTEEETEEEERESVSKQQCVVAIGEGLYRVDCHPLHARSRLFYLLIFNDITELSAVKQLHRDQLTAVGYITLDNLEEIAQYMQVSYQTETRQVEAILRQWAANMNGVLREYEKNKYMILLNRKMLSTCLKTKFDILDEVRSVRLGEDDMPITVSMGIATTGETLAARERDAMIALDLALQRGGDQVVLKNDTGNHYFGGRTKSRQKRTRGHSRIIAKRLCAMMTAATNVVVMGHGNPDFDSIGACVGIAALAIRLGVEVKIVTDTECDNFRACTARLTDLADYKNIFMDGVAGLEYSSFGTLLIVVDANNFTILEAPEIAAHSFKTVVIDHHIKKDEFETEPQLAYIDPTASSACELITEILEQSLPEGSLRKEEANLLMSGIMVDTKNFTRTVGTRTFAAALYLRGAGASTEYARTFFEEAFEDYHTEAQFGSEARIYRDQIAITALEGSGSGGDRVAAAKAADKLLGVRNVQASFALISIGNTVHISARSTGSINVQLILEKIGGGGHFDVAGAALAESSLAEAEKVLLSAIDEYLKENTK